MPLRARTSAFAVLAAIATFVASPASAQQSVADFYKGKTVSLLLGTGPGGSYDLYARIFAEHLPRHIPGNPSIVVEHMPGAGGVTAGNHLYGPGPQDGTKILLSHAIIMSEVLDPRYAPIELSIDVPARRARVRIPDLVDSEGSPIIDPHSGNEHRAQIRLPNGFEYTVAEVGTGRTRTRGEIALELDGSHGHFTVLHMNQDGVLR